MFRDLMLEDIFALQEKGPHTFIDVRSPKEFKEATIPGSINIPVFDDEERAEIGTLYKQVGQEVAKERGLAIFAKKLPNFISAFKNIETPMTVFCWRGGMRSKTAATVLDLMGIHTTRLNGGVRSYRQWVVHELEKEDFSPDFIVLNGNTGTGKTEILKRLADNGYPVIDFENIAGHRGSIFGQIGLEPSNQKKFDSLLIHELERFKTESHVFIEGESRRIGKVSLPQYIYDKKESGMQIVIHLPLAERVKIVLADYEPWNNPERFKEAFQLIERRLHTPIAKLIETYLDNGEFGLAVELLLEHYYDPRYRHSGDKNTDLQKVDIEAKNVEDAFKKILQTIERIKTPSLS
ncbi:tRNA 2-selenouridine(34) synthase MnmH [Sporosarcina sp. E16_8]|uniref:tRNA 2-selenouridine(34) synthase MnmH n=1 Tax=Sporosarcina sp. E16_8 TaxID=2789295 RepID=UPI001A9389F6|nr:tRNA 2-selenouridine(34) synthase MnmH [Sporosarcina sp. E16_8]MBO0586977.1 tRNA 2-selenouridine(34) synthase MnmH [Sporosarcina sp. E16_8]